jgi:hypothetical protein
MKPGHSITLALIAPCGMNCGICMAYLREKNSCPGCRVYDPKKTKIRIHCKIKNCVKLKKHGSKYCLSCDIMPCERLAHLDKRYRTKYGMSMLENLANIKLHGARQFVKNEISRWRCPECGGTICVHRWNCSSCGKKRQH